MASPNPYLRNLAFHTNLTNQEVLKVLFFRSCCFCFFRVVHLSGYKEMFSLIYYVHLAFGTSNASYFVRLC